MALDAPAQDGPRSGDRCLALLPLRCNSDQLFSVIWSSSAAVRAEGMRTIARTLEELIFGQPEPPPPPGQLRCHLDLLQRVTLRCPYADVREAGEALINSLQSRGVKLPVVRTTAISAFIPQGILEFSAAEDEALALLETSFSATGRASHAYRLMCLFPSFARQYQMVYETLLYGPGPLPYDWRLYLAIMGAAESNCTYLISQHEVNFYASGGNPDWLLGLNRAPAKLQRLNELNVLLARQPWRVTAEVVQPLLSGADAWSLPDLMQAVAILVTFHCLAAMVWGVAAMPEIDREGGTVDPNEDSNGPPALAPAVTPGATPERPAEPVASDTNAELIGKLRRLQVSDDDGGAAAKPAKVGPSPTVVGLLESDGGAGGGTRGAVGASRTDLAGSASEQPSDSRRYCDASDVPRSLFECSSDLPLFRLHDFSWEDHAFSVFGRFYPGIERPLDDLFRETLSMTDFALFMEKNVDTSPFRLAIWYWVLYEKGMVHDDYDYSNWSTLNPKVSNYARLVACRPEDVTWQDYNNMGVDLFDREKVHINLLIMEARRQAELVYFAHAVARATGE